MGNIIIAIILVLIFVWAIRGSIKHFRGEGGCCGGSAPVKPPKKQLKEKIVKTYILSIEGMHCQNCAYNVERAINELDGSAAKVNLKKKEAKVCCDREVDIELIIVAVEKRGYKVFGVKVECAEKK